MGTLVVQDGSEQGLRPLIDFIWTKHQQTIPALTHLIDALQDITGQVERCKVVGVGVHPTCIQLVGDAYDLAAIAFQYLQAKVH